MTMPNPQSQVAGGQTERLETPGWYWTENGKWPREYDEVLELSRRLDEALARIRQLEQRLPLSIGEQLCEVGSRLDRLEHRAGIDDDHLPLPTPQSPREGLSAEERRSIEEARRYHGHRPSIKELFAIIDRLSPPSPTEAPSFPPVSAEVEKIAHEIVQVVIEEWGNNELFIDRTSGPGEQLRVLIANALTSHATSVTAALKAELATWQRYASYCNSCAKSGEHEPQTFEAFIRHLEQESP